MKVVRPLLQIGRAAALILTVYLVCGLYSAFHTILPLPRALLGVGAALSALAVVISFDRRNQ